MTEPVRIFLSYAHADGDAVGRIYERLKAQGYKPWIDREDIIGGERWEPAIRAGIRESDLFLLCMSRHSLLRRGVLQREIKAAFDAVEEKLDTDIFLIPIWIQVGAPLPTEEMPERLSGIQWINLAEADGWRKLIRSIDLQSRHLGREVSPSLSMGGTPTGASNLSAADIEQLILQLRTALDGSDAARVRTAAASIVDTLRRPGHGFTEQHARRVLNQLWRRHLVALVQLVADAFVLSGIDALPVRRFYAEALLEQRWLTATFDALASLEQATLSDQTERALVADLRGRAHTAAYLAAVTVAPEAAAKQLWKAVAAYHDVYNSDSRRHLLHGARAAALVQRATRSGLSPETTVTPTDVAARVLDEVRDSVDNGRPLSLDECEAAVHAALALEHHDQVPSHLARYLEHPQIDVVSLRTLDNQLTDVWQLRQNVMPGSSLMPPLEARLKAIAEPWLSIAVTSVPQSEAEVPAARLETIFPTSDFKTLAWYRRGLACAQNVARVETVAGKGVATGFLLPGRLLHPALPDEPLLLTNSYVVTNDPSVRAEYAFTVFGPEELRARFQTEDRVYELEVVWTSFSAGTTILKLKSTSDERERSDPLRIGRPTSVACILGYPGGRDLEFSLSDTQILDRDDRVLHYRTPTEPGSSGSPVFNDLWEVIAIHHAGGNEMPRLHGRIGTYAANEGIQIEFIRNTIAQALGIGDKFDARK